MSSPIYTTPEGVSLFVGINSTGSLVPLGVGFSLIATGTLLRLVQEQLKAATGQQPNFALVYAEAVTCIALLLLQGTIAHQVWDTAQSIATDIYPDSKSTAATKALIGVVERFKDYQFSLFDMGAAAKDSAVVLVAAGAWMLTLLAHWQLETLQVAVFNVVFAFAPILIGLSMFGFGGRRIWFAALVEVASWSITMAIVYKTIDSAMHGYLAKAKTLALTDTSFIDVIALLSFMASLPFVVPIVTGRLIGTAALGALANVTAGGTLVDRFFGSGRQAAQELGGSVQPGAQDVSSHTEADANAPILRRPGD
jgi:hypothetical protein